MSEVDTAPRRICCPRCAIEFETVRQLIGGAPKPTPSTGDIIGCAWCGGAMVIDAGGVARAMTKGQFLALRLESRIALYGIWHRALHSEQRPA